MPDIKYWEESYVYKYNSTVNWANWAILYMAHIEHAIRVHLSHLVPFRDVWLGHNEYFM